MPLYSENAMIFLKIIFQCVRCAFSVEVCTAVFTDVESLLEHLWICDMRSKFMDRNSEQFVCLECGKSYKGEKCTDNHVRKHHQVSPLITSVASLAAVSLL